MILVDIEYWTVEVPVWDLLQSLNAKHHMPLTLVDTIEKPPSSSADPARLELHPRVGVGLL